MRSGWYNGSGSKPVTIRTLDPPLHEFIGTMDSKQIKDLSKKIKMSPAAISKRIHSLHEENPMLGTRGVRLGMLIPGLVRMQVRAIFEAACNVARKTKKKPHPEVMIPLIATSNLSTMVFTPMAISLAFGIDSIFGTRRDN